jgi:hypothetical protein
VEREVEGVIRRVGHGTQLPIRSAGRDSRGVRGRGFGPGRLWHCAPTARRLPSSGVSPRQNVGSVDVGAVLRSVARTPGGPALDNVIALPVPGPKEELLTLLSGSHLLEGGNFALPCRAAWKK